MMTTPTKDKKEPNIVWKEMARLCAPWTWKRKEMRGLQVLRASQKLSSLVDSKEGPQAQPSRSGLGPGAGQWVTPGASLRRRSLAGWGSYMALGVNVSRGCQVPNWHSYFSHWFFLPSSTLTDHGISFLLLILSSPLLCLKQLSAQWILRNLNCPFQPCFPGLDSPKTPEVPKGLWAKAGAQAHPKDSQIEDRWSGLSVKPPSLPCVTHCHLWRTMCDQAELSRRLPSASGKTWSEPANWGSQAWVVRPWPSQTWKSLTF